MNDFGSPRTTSSSSGSFPGRAELPLDTISWGPDLPGDDALRLITAPRGKKILQLGIGLGHNAVSLALAGAHVIAVDHDISRIDAARQLAEVNEVKLELHHGDLADIAFIRADQIDLALSVYALARADDLDRVFRQVNRVLRTSGTLSVSLPHPAWLMLDQELGVAPQVARRYGENPQQGVGDAEIQARSISEIFGSFARANFRVDAVLEPEALSGRAMVPSTIIIRGRKDGT
ncbi:MAG: class I SAM-dependent methyltransferase [Acidimicrobiales bacterium]